MAMQDRDMAKALHLVELRNISPESLAAKIAGCIKSARKKTRAEERARHRKLFYANHPAVTCACAVGSEHKDCPTAAGIYALGDPDPDSEEMRLRKLVEEAAPWVEDAMAHSAGPEEWLARARALGVEVDA